MFCMDKKENMIQRMFGKWWFRHLFFWIVLLNWFAWGIGIMKLPVIGAYMRSLAMMAGGIIIVYAVLYFLIPRFLVKRKFLLFFLGYIVLIAFGAIVRAIVQQVTPITLTPYGFLSI